MHERRVVQVRAMRQATKRRARSSFVALAANSTTMRPLPWPRSFLIASPAHQVVGCGSSLENKYGKPDLSPLSI